MKICFISFSSPQTSVGGIERYLDTTMKELTKRGFVVHLITSAYKKEEVVTTGNLTIHNLKAMNLKTRNQLEASKKLYKYLKKLIKKEDIDIISAENFYRGTPPGYAFAVNLASMETKTPIILRMHAHFNQDLEKALVKDLFWDKVIPVSKNVSSEAYDIGVKVDKLTTVYPPIDTEIFRPELGENWLSSRIKVNANDTIILHASRITGSKTADYLELKGLLTLLKAFSILNQTNKNIKLLIATGSAPPTWAGEYEKAKKKIFEIAELNGIKNKEALACGIPVIGTSVGGVPEIIDNGKTGFLVEPDNPVELAKKIQFLINNPKKRKKMGEKGRKIIERRFNVKKTTDNLIGIFNSITNKKGINPKNKTLPNFQII